MNSQTKFNRQIVLIVMISFVGIYTSAASLLRAESDLEYSFWLVLIIAHSILLGYAARLWRSDKHYYELREVTTKAIEELAGAVNENTELKKHNEALRTYIRENKTQPNKV